MEMNPSYLMDRRVTASDLDSMLFDKDAQPMALPFSLLKEITDNFSEKIGDGGFSVVYLGKLANGLVAVKRLNEESMDEKSFEREVQCLMQVKHENIVRFLGFCGQAEMDMRTNRGEFVRSSREQMLLCFEFVPEGSLHNYIQGPSTGLDWTKRYEIIRGICAGLYYLHNERIVHLDLKPGNILLDENMVPKITDFGLARSFKENKTHVTATNQAGTDGYMAPEYNRKNITYKYDLYSLGVIIMEIMMGEKGHQHVDNVLESWSNMLKISEGNMQWEQIRECAKIGIECIESDPAKRPGCMKDIIDRLEAAGSGHIIRTGSGQIDLLGVHPFVLCFPFEPNETSSCSLWLTNNTDEHVAFRLVVDKSRESSQHCFVRVPLYGLLPPRSTCTLVVTTRDKNTQTEKIVIDLLLESTRLCGSQDSGTFHSQPEKFFNTAKEMQDVFHEIKLKALYNPRRRIITSYKPISPRIKILSKGRPYQKRFSIDASQGNQWIVTGEDFGHIRIWNYRTQRMVYSLKVSRERVTCVKFIARKKWLVAGFANGYVHVYDCQTQLQKILSFSATNGYLLSLAVHPVQPYLLLAYGCEMKLLDWSKGWECIQRFDREHKDTICEVAFDVEDTIASASKDHTVKVWNLDSPKSNYTLSGHSNKVNCLHFFTSNDQEYLVTGSDDCTAKVWDMQKRICVDTIEASMSPVWCVLYQANLRIIITGSENGSVYFWSSANSRINSQSYSLERIINIGVHGSVHGIKCLNQRVLIGKEDAMAIIDIDNENDHEDPMDCCKTHENTDMIRGNMTSKVIAGSVSELLTIQSREIMIPSHFPELSFLDLTNNTDEYVAFRLIDMNPNASMHYQKAYLYGIVPPRLNYTFIVKLLGKRDIPVNEKGRDFFLQKFEYLCPAIQSSVLGDKYMVPFKYYFECDDFLRDTKEMGNAVHELILKAVPNVSKPQNMKISTSPWNSTDDLLCIDAHPTEPWIVAGDSWGRLMTWSYDDSKSINPQDVVSQSNRHVNMEEQIVTIKFINLTATHVNCVKIIPRLKRIVAGTSDCFLHVYSCDRVGNMKKITSLSDTTTSLDIHPAQTYVLSSSLKLWFPQKKETHTSLKLWNWNEDWNCTETFGYVGVIRRAVFNPVDANSFATIGSDPIVQVWTLDSSEPKYTLSGHSGKVNCLSFFTRRGQQYLITGSDDGTAKIWDLQKKVCIHTLEAMMYSVTCVSSFPGRRPFLLTGSEHGSIYVWRTTDFRLQRIVHYSSGGPVCGLICLLDSRRVVIGQTNAISIMDINEEEADASEGGSNIDINSEEAVASGGANNENSDVYSCISWLPGIICSICNTWSR